MYSSVLVRTVVSKTFDAFASLVKGRKKAEHVVAWLVPGSWMVTEQIKAEGLDRILEEAGFELRQPGCSACLAMNDDKIPAGKLSVSTSNRNFEGRQGPCAHCTGQSVGGGRSSRDGSNHRSENFNVIQQ